LRPNNPDDGIEAVRIMLPRCWFDRSKCEHGLEALKQYRKDWDEKLKAFRDKPKHDWTSHAADAFRYLAVGLTEVREKRKVHAYAGGTWMG
jgi:phage terminase large subunit